MCSSPRRGDCYAATTKASSDKLDDLERRDGTVGISDVVDYAVVSHEAASRSGSTIVSTSGSATTKLVVAGRTGRSRRADMSRKGRRECGGGQIIAIDVLIGEDDEPVEGRDTDASVRNGGLVQTGEAL
jgi:hypothetical protein